MIRNRPGGRGVEGGIWGGIYWWASHEHDPAHLDHKSVIGHPVSLNRPQQIKYWILLPSITEHQIIPILSWNPALVTILGDARTRWSLPLQTETSREMRWEAVWECLSKGFWGNLTPCIMCLVKRMSAASSELWIPSGIVFVSITTCYFDLI